MTARERFAISIGINQHRPESKLHPLYCAENDARAIDALLGQLGFPATNRRLLLGEQATLEAINQALEELVLDRPGPDDLVVFYFAGHGVPVQIQQADDSPAQVEVFLAPHDFDRQKAQQRAFRLRHALSLRRLREEFFEGEGARQRLFLIDTCHSGDFYGAAYRSADGEGQLYSVLRHAFQSRSPGRVAICSCLPEQQAREDISTGHGLMTYHLLRGLRGQAPEAMRQDGCVTVNTLFEHLARAMPPEQRPVLSGVQHDTFELVWFAAPQLGAAASPAYEQVRQELERQGRLRALLRDHASFMADRMASFVGREAELAEIKGLIQAQLANGGYVTVTGHAGQGKSSVIARLVQDYGATQVAHHFIPLNPGPDHQVSLLRDLMARLALKHARSELYVSSESRPALRDYFANLLADIADGAQEIIFIDGLDQLEEDLNGVRDLSFLPSRLPPGIVVVLSTRPNDTLKPLELLTERVEYPLPGLSRADFDLLLARRQVQIAPELANRFYGAMAQNALYLDLVARELAQQDAGDPEHMIERISADPANLFGLALNRLRRRRAEWHTLSKPALGLLLVAQQPLSMRALRTILQVDEQDLREELQRLGGLLARDGDGRYYLYHLKLRDFLRQDEHDQERACVFPRDEEVRFHQLMASWCTRQGAGLAAIWQAGDGNVLEQERRGYAREHTVAHLYHANAWAELWELLDAGSFSQAKIRHDPSMGSLIKDLDLARRGAVEAGRTMPERLALLPRLWRYSLLRGSLTSHADNYPGALFTLLVRLGRLREALGLLELQTRPDDKVRVLTSLGRLLATDLGQHEEAEQVLFRAHELARAIDVPHWSVQALAKVGLRLSQIGQLEQGRQALEEARRKALGMEQGEHRDRAIAALVEELITGDRVDEARALLKELPDPPSHDFLLNQLAEHQIASGRLDEAVETVALLATYVERGYWADALGELARALCAAGQPARAATLLEAALPHVFTLTDSYRQIEALGIVGTGLIHAGEQERGLALLDQAYAMVPKQEYETARSAARFVLVDALSKIGAWEQARKLMDSIQEHIWRSMALEKLVRALSKAGEWQRALDELAASHDARLLARNHLVYELTLQGQRERALELLRSLPLDERAHTFHRMLYALARDANLEGVAEVLEESMAADREALSVVGEDQARPIIALGLARTGQVVEAQALLENIADANNLAPALRGVAQALIERGETAPGLAMLERAARLGEEQLIKLEWGSWLDHELGPLVDALVTHGLQLQARELLKRARAVVQGIAETLEREGLQRGISAALARMGDWDSALEIAGQIRHPKLHVRALTAVAEALLAAGEQDRLGLVLDQARGVAAQLESAADRLAALAQVAEVLLLAGDRARAMTLVDEILDAARTQPGESRRLVKVLARLRRWDDAVELALTITGESNQTSRVGALTDVVLELAAAGEQARARALLEQAAGEASAILYPHRRSAALCHVVIALAELGEHLQAQAYLQAISDDEPQAQALEALAQILAREGHGQLLLETIQQLWLRAPSRKHLLGTFGVTAHLIAQHPALGLELAAGFEWVRTMLIMPGGKP